MNRFDGRKILVTGGAGFIGSHITDRLVAEGYDVHVLDNLLSGRIEQIPEGATFHEMDVRDAAVEDLFARERFDAMFHLAAQMDVRRSVADPKFDADVNVLGFLNLMEAGRKHGLRRVVFSSTGGAIYGEPDPEINDAGPQPEHHPQRPLSPYGITKLVSEKYLYFYEQSYGISYAAMRYANVYGPRQNPHGEAGVVAIFTERMLKGEQPFINGEGLQTRDYTFVGDVVRATVAGLHYAGSDIFNVGTGIETNVVELFRHLNELTGDRVAERHAEGKPGEQQRSVLDASKAGRLLGWQPGVDLRDGLAQTVEWFKQKLGAEVGA
jgi:UDP-glucose 4-epimerase